MATQKKTADVDYSMQEKIMALYELQKIDSKIDANQLHFVLESGNESLRIGIRQLHNLTGQTDATVQILKRNSSRRGTLLPGLGRFSFSRRPPIPELRR